MPAERCPNCDAPLASSSVQRWGRKVLVLAATVTLMACYGAVDIPSPSCTTDPSFCPCDGDCDEEVDCNDGIDNDADGFIDCDDGACSEECPHETVCDDGFDDDGDGAVDCNDTDCDCSPEFCWDGVDNDLDGAIDCMDTSDCDCSSEESCTNAFDDDHDGVTDCKDADCACTTEVDCDDDFDDDDDTLLDCADPDCAAACVTELQCHNGFDDDGDGLTDCDDEECAAACVGCGDGGIGFDEECDDGANIDGDGCSSSCALEYEIFCALLPELQLGATQGDTQLGTRAIAGSCFDQDNVGPEQSFGFVAPAAGTLYLTLDPTSYSDMGLRVILGCGETASELACANEGSSYITEHLELLLPSGTAITITVLARGWGRDDSYTLLANFVPTEG